MQVGQKEFYRKSTDRRSVLSGDDRTAPSGEKKKKAGESSRKGSCSCTDPLLGVGVGVGVEGIPELFFYLVKDEAGGKLRYLCLISPIKYPVHVRSRGNHQILR